MKILVTGGAGYLGSVLVPALLRAANDVTVVDDFRFGQEPFNHLCGHRGFEVVRADARAWATIKPLAAEADVVIPLAAIVGAPACDADQVGATTTNLGPIVALCENAKPSVRILIPITNSGYGIGQPGVACTEESPLRPISLYGETKVEAEKVVLARGNSISFRLATVFGMSPRMRLDLLVNDFVWRAYRDRAVVLFEADFKRNYIHIEDVARVFLHGLKNFNAMEGRAYNVGLSDANLSKRELCERIKHRVQEFVWHEAAVGSDPDKRDYVVSNARIEATGWRPSKTLDDGIVELLKGYRMLRRNQHGNV